jgi:hypothetical protein
MNQLELNRLKLASIEGDAEAQHKIGELLISGAYVDGAFVKQDIPQGLDLIRKSASQGYTPAKVYLYDNETSLLRRLKKRRSRNRMPILFLLGFVAVLIFLGVLEGMHYGWKDTVSLGLPAILSATSCFWIVLIADLLQRMKGLRRRAPATELPGAKTPIPTVFVFLFGVVMIIVLLVIAFKFPSPTAFQYTVFRIVLALAAAGIAAFIPGFLKLKLKNWLSASGALAVFAIVYFFSPAALVTNPAPGHISTDSMPSTTRAH